MLLPHTANADAMACSTLPGLPPSCCLHRPLCNHRRTAAPNACSTCIRGLQQHRYLKSATQPQPWLVLCRGAGCTAGMKTDGTHSHEVVPIPMKTMFVAVLASPLSARSRFASTSCSTICPAERLCRRPILQEHGWVQPRRPELETDRKQPTGKAAVWLRPPAMLSAREMCHSTQQVTKYAAGGTSQW